MTFITEACHIDMTTLENSLARVYLKLSSPKGVVQDYCVESKGNTDLMDCHEACRDLFTQLMESIDKFPLTCVKAMLVAEFIYFYEGDTRVRTMTLDTNRSERVIDPEKFWNERIRILLHKCDKHLFVNGVEDLKTKCITIKITKISSLS